MPEPASSIKNHKLHFTLAPPDSQMVRDGLYQITHELRAKNLAEIDLCNIELVLAEIANNIVEHAFYNCQSTDDEKIEIFLEITPHSLLGKVIDNGCRMPYSSLPEGAPPRIGRSVETLPEGGFGWFLIRKFTKTISYMRKNNQNVLNFSMQYGSNNFGFY